MSYDASDSSTDSNKMFNLFEKTIMKIGKENVVQVVTDNASENKKAGNMLKGVFPHIFWTPCAAHCINLMFGDIFKEAPYSKALRVGGPLIHVLRMVDGEKKPPMGYIYEAMDRAKESIEKAFNYDTRKYKSVFEIIDARWTDQLHQPLHAAGHILNPGLYYKNNDMKTLTEDVWQGYHKCVERMIPDKNLQDKIGEELGVYMKADGLLGIESAIRARTLRSPVEWWMQYGHNVPNLQQFAIRVQSLTCSASGCERNWSVYEHIHSKKRNRLELTRLNDLVFIKYNRTLARRYNARNTIDPILLDSIDEANEWLTGAPQDHQDEEVYEGESLTYGDVSMASGVEENIYSFRRRDWGEVVGHEGFGGSSKDASSMQDRTVNCIMEVAREVLGISRGLIVEWSGTIIYYLLLISYII
ncbi:hypothetical protein KY289_005329 [Solanum tuberosum]|nr:hypothetical protein KY289_005329 [Solanum tuberosum]